MYPSKFDYYRAKSVSEAVSLLKEHSGAKVLAGGHSIIPAMNLRLSRPEVLIDIGRIDELKGINVSKGIVKIGALTTHATIAVSTDVPQGLSEAAAAIGDSQVRNRGTIGGNISHADPASDLPTVLTALNAMFHVQGSGGERTIPATDFFTGLFETALKDDEIVTVIELSVDNSSTGSAYTKLDNPASRYAIVGVAALIKVENGKCSDVSVAVGGVTSQVKKATSVESALKGKEPDNDNIAAAAMEVQHDIGDDILDDMHASAGYRKQMTTVFVKRAIQKAVERSG